MTPMPDDDTRAGGPAPAPSRLRAADADRHATIQVLQDAVGRGLLTPDEGSERMAAAYAARYLPDLASLTVDLPPAVAPAAAPPGWRPLAGLAVLQARAALSALAADGLRSRRALAVASALIVVLLTLVVLGAAGLHLLFVDPHGEGGFRPNH